ncbi:MAG: putative transcriptional regulator, partial [Neolewinella sp.]
TSLHQLPGIRPLPPRVLATLLEAHYGYTIVPNGLDAHPDLQMLRAVYQPEENRLLLNGNLTPAQRGFQFGKELAFNYLRLAERANTSSLLRSRVFEEVLNHSKATYFSVALHIPLQPFTEQLKTFFALPTWDPKAFLGLMQRFNATPEMFYHRLTNVLPQLFGLREMFFLRFLHDPQTDDFTIDKELHLHRRHHPHENGLFEHYCRRWVSLSLLKDIPTNKTGQAISIDVQRSHYYGTEDEYLCLTMARTNYPEEGRNVSLTLGFLINDELREIIAWNADPAISNREVNTTCERCPISDCKERAAEPVVVRKRERNLRIKAALKKL